MPPVRSAQFLALLLLVAAARFYFQRRRRSLPPAADSVLAPEECKDLEKKIKKSFFDFEKLGKIHTVKQHDDVELHVRVFHVEVCRKGEGRVVMEKNFLDEENFGGKKNEKNFDDKSGKLLREEDLKVSSNRSDEIEKRKLEEENGTENMVLGGKYDQGGIVMGKISRETILGGKNAMMNKSLDGNSKNMDRNATATTANFVGGESLKHNLETAQLWKDSVANDEEIVVMVMTGWSESVVKYHEFVFELLGHNVDKVVLMDHRSQGYSDKHKHRAGEEGLDLMKSHVEDFQEHIDDAKLVYDTFVKDKTDRKQKIFVFGFSLGGLVAARLATLVPLDGLILLAPCLSPKTGYPPFILNAGLKLARVLGLGRNFVPGHPTDMDHRSLPPPLSRVSSSLSRIRFWEMAREKTPSLIINGMSISHLSALLTARFDTQADFDSILAKKVLLISAGLDAYVENDAMDAFYNARQDIVLIERFPTGKHELLQERDEIRDQVVASILRFVALA